jgi:hypothetical protein
MPPRPKEKPPWSVAPCPRDASASVRPDPAPALAEESISPIPGAALGFPREEPVLGFCEIAAGASGRSRVGAARGGMRGDRKERMKRFLCNRWQWWVFFYHLREDSRIHVLVEYLLRSFTKFLEME